MDFASACRRKVDVKCLPAAGEKGASVWRCEADLGETVRRLFHCCPEIGGIKSSRTKSYQEKTARGGHPQLLHKAQGSNYRPSSNRRQKVL